METMTQAPKQQRQPMYENEMCKAVGMIASCNECDRIIFDDENHKEKYTASGGYCSHCIAQQTLEAIKSGTPFTYPGGITPGRVFKIAINNRGDLILSANDLKRKEHIRDEYALMIIRNVNSEKP